MAVGDIVYARFPITIDSSAAEDSSVNVVLSTLFPVANYTLIHTELVFASGTTTKATVVIIAQEVA